MPMFDFQCDSDGCQRQGLVEEHFLHPRNRDKELPCEECGNPLRRLITFCYQRKAQAFAPVVIHKSADGTVRFPAVADAAVPDGYEKVELRTVSEVRRFERQMNASERAVYDESQERKERAYSEDLRERRSELRAAMRNMSPFGRDFARLVMAANDRRSRGRYEPGFHVEAFSQDSSNREPHMDERTGWKARRA